MWYAIAYEINQCVNMSNTTSLRNPSLITHLRRIARVVITFIFIIFLGLG